eukprot:81838-Chlamydomonas_euryale.AAC.5
MVDSTTLWMVPGNQVDSTRLIQPGGFNQVDSTIHTWLSHGQTWNSQTVKHRTVKQSNMEQPQVDSTRLSSHVSWLNQPREVTDCSAGLCVGCCSPTISRLAEDLTHTPPASA